MSRLRDPAEYVSKAKHRWAGHIMRRIDDRWTKRTLEWIPRDAKRPRGRPPTRWSDVFAARMDQLRAQLDTAQGPRQRHSRSLRTSWMTMARERNEWKRCWGPHKTSKIGVRTQLHVEQRQLQKGNARVALASASQGRATHSSSNPDIALWWVQPLTDSEENLESLTASEDDSSLAYNKDCRRRLEEAIGAIEACTSGITQLLREYASMLHSLKNPSKEDYDDYDEYATRVEEVLSSALDYLVLIEACSRSFLSCSIGNARGPANSSFESASDAELRTRKLELPTLPVPTFSGNIWEWDNFWSLFDANIHSQPLSGLFKFNCLLNALKGDAHAVVNKFQVSLENYEKALKFLKAKYGNSEELVNRLIDRIDRMSLRSTSLRDQRTLFEELQVIVSQLRQKGEHVGSQWLQKQVLSKFPEQLQRKVLEKKHAMTPDASFSMDTLLKFLEDVISSEEMDEQSFAKQGPTSTSPAKKTSASKDLQKVKATTNINHLSAPQDDQDTTICELQSAQKYQDNVGTFLPTGELTVMDPMSKKLKEVAVLLDTGAELSFIDNSLAEELGLPTLEETTLRLPTFGSEQIQEELCRKVPLETWDKEGNPISLQLLTHRILTKSLVPPPVLKEDLEYIRRMNLPIRLNERQLRIKPLILLGCDQLWSLIRVDQSQLTLPLGLHLLPTRLGHLLTCHLQSALNTVQVCHQNRKVQGWTECWSLDARVNVISTNASSDIVDEKELWARYWSLEAAGTEKFTESEKSVQSEQLHQNIVEEVEDEGKTFGDHIHYIPQAVLTPYKATTKLRIVFDASAHHRDCPSLNDALHRGPVILPQLYGLMLRFRIGKVAIISDVEKAFLQVRLQERDRDATRCLWLRDHKSPPDQENILILRFTRVTFGLLSSPFLLAATTHYNLDQYENDSILVKEIKENLYVDNLLLTADTVEDAVKVYSCTKEMFNAPNMNIREFVSNEQDLMSAIASHDKSAELTESSRD
ncbi:hypothetical protein RB195_022365 [Necator americanus]|uniref:Tas retrotransposon peptidase A16 n=1 Tax=Necator americanus TaxID=51031 RepID=A0ABR1EF19_NECAM